MPSRAVLKAQTFSVVSQLHGLTITAVLRQVLDGIAWTQARELCNRGKVRLNGAVQTDAAKRVRAGDRIAVDPVARRRRPHALSDEDVLHVDRHVVVINKPAGVLSVPYEDSDKNTLIDRVGFWLRRKDGVGRAQLGAVQRLDKDTTGVLVFTRTAAAKRHLQAQFREHSIERRYLALVHGTLATERSIETTLVPNRGDGLRGSWERTKNACLPAPSAGQRAITHLRPLQRLEGATLVECRLHTGRQHQIRIHLSELGHMLIGEKVYVRDHHGPRIAVPGPMLHAAVLGFIHPHTERPMRVEQPLPDDFEKLRRSLAHGGDGGDSGGANGRK